MNLNNLKGDRKLWENIASLMSVQAISYLIPLATLPFLTHRLGVLNWGGLAFAEAFASYASLIMDFGFGLSASRDIARLQNSKMECSKYLSNVVAAQCCLAAMVFAASIICMLFVKSISDYRSLLPLAMMLALCRSLFPAWLFQGLEKMRTIAIVNFIANIAAAASLFIFIKNKNDAGLVLIVRTGGALLSLALSFTFAYTLIPFSYPSVRGVVYCLRASWRLFVFRGVISLYTTANVLLLGALGAPLAVAAFAGAEKFVKVGLSALGPITQSFFPRISKLIHEDKDAAPRVLNLSLWVTIGTGFFSCLALIFLAPWIVPHFLGTGFNSAIPVLRIMSLVIPTIAASQVLGIQWMISQGMENAYTLIILFAGVINIILAVLLVPREGAIGMAISVVVAELIVTVGGLLYLHLKGVAPWTKPEKHLSLI